jgi:TusE/DsrC/DsvC family sulfur relay protein
MPILEHGSLKIEVDEEGYLLDTAKWNRAAACALAENEGIEELTEERLEIIQFLREYYLKYNYFPILHSICLHVHQPAKCVNEQFIHPLKAWKIAGLPRPDDVVLAYLNYGQTPT